MTTQQQEQRSDKPDTRSKHSKRLSRRSLVIITVLLLAVAIIIIWILSYFNVIPSFWVAIFTIIITVFGAVFAFFQSMHLFLPAEKHESTETSPYSNAKTDIPSAATKVALSSAKPAYRGIVGLPPPTDPRIIQQREQVVKEVYAKLIQSDITAIALTGIGGVGKSTLAALIYHYVEEQRQTNTSSFLAETVWLAIDPAATFADLAGNLFEALSKPLPDFGNLAPQNQAVALVNALNSINPRDAQRAC